MKKTSVTITLVTLISLGLAACASDTLPPPEGSPLAGTITSGAPFPSERPGRDNHSNVFISYHCDNGRTIQAEYPTTHQAQVRYGGQTRTMYIVESADGARYTDGSDEWWTRGSGPGSEATLFKHQAGGWTGKVLTTCRQASAAQS